MLSHEGLILIVPGAGIGHHYGFSRRLRLGSHLVTSTPPSRTDSQGENQALHETLFNSSLSYKHKAPMLSHEDLVFIVPGAGIGSSSFLHGRSCSL
jgi:hypothetical protein